MKCQATAQPRVGSTLFIARQSARSYPKSLWRRPCIPLTPQSSTAIINNVDHCMALNWLLYYTEAINFIRQLWRRDPDPPFFSSSSAPLLQLSFPITIIITASASTTTHVLDWLLFPKTCLDSSLWRILSTGYFRFAMCNHHGLTNVLIYLGHLWSQPQSPGSAGWQTDSYPLLVCQRASRKWRSVRPLPFPTCYPKHVDHQLNSWLQLSHRHLVRHRQTLPFRFMERQRH